MRPWREILKDDDAVAAILAVSITMAIALIFVGCLGFGCYEDPKRVTQVAPDSTFNVEPAQPDTVRKHYYGPGGFKMNIEEILGTDSVMIIFTWSADSAWSADSVGGAKWVRLPGFINPDSTPAMFSLKPKKLRLLIMNSDSKKP